MKKNQRTYFLIAVVLTIWGLLGFRILTAVHHKDTKKVTTVEHTQFKPALPKARDTFSILADYRDPFLGTLPKSKIPARPSKKIVSAPMVKRNISYTGHIMDHKANKVIFFVNIDGQQHMMSIKDEVNGVKLQLGNEDRITVHYENRREIIKRSP